MVAINRTEQEKTALIERYIRRDPRKPGLYNSVFVGTGVAVYMVIINFERDNDGDIARAASEYYLEPEAVEAALAFYERNKCAIDARIEEDQAWYTSETE